MRLTLTLLALAMASSTRSQSVSVIKDPRIDLLVKKQYEHNKKVEILNKKSGPGYRVMVINTNDRVKALEIVAPLAQGQTKARETPRRKPIRRSSLAPPRPALPRRSPLRPACLVMACSTASENPPMPAWKPKAEAAPMA